MFKENRSIKRKATNMTEFPDFYTKEQIREVYETLSNDSRLSKKTRAELLTGLRKVYKSK